MSTKRFIQTASALIVMAAAAGWPNEAAAGDGATYCGSGGVGAGSCSNSTCSVGCITGYACCNASGCKCVTA